MKNSKKNYELFDEIAFKKRLANRYQFQPWYIKAWRWIKISPSLALIPWYSLRIYLAWKESWKQCLRIAGASAQLRLEHWYTLEEVKERAKKDKINKGKTAN